MDDVAPETTDPQNWVEEGLISFEQADAIDGGRPSWDPPRLVEVLLYLGLAAFSIAALIWYLDLITSAYWEEPNHWGGFLVAVVGVCVLTGVTLILNRSRGGIRRAAGALMAIAVLLSSLAIGSVFDAIEFSGQWAQLVMSLLISVAAIGAWWLRKSVPTEIALFLGVSSVLVAIIEVIEESSINTDLFAAAALNPETITGIAAGLLIWLFGGAWIWLGSRGILRSANTAYLLGGATAVLSGVGLTAGVNRWWIFLLAITTLALCAAGGYLKNSLLMVVGTIAVMISVPVGMLGWLRETPGAGTWATIYGVPGLLLLLGSVAWADRIRIAE